MQLRCSVVVIINGMLDNPGWATNPEIQRCGDNFLNLVMDKIVFYARRNVQPGLGPGPHPHRTKHMDTGTLARAIIWSKVPGVWGGRTVHVAPSAVNYLNNVPAWYYGAVLERGWHAGKDGTFYKYPWMAPAVDRVAQDVPEYLKTHFWRPLSAQLEASRDIRREVWSNMPAHGRIWATYQ